MIKKLRNVKESNPLRFFTYTVYFVCLLIVFLLFCAIILNIFMHDGNVRESYIFNKRPTIVITGSMEPTITVNSLVILEPVEFNDLQEGDIIRYTSYMGFSIMHRIVHKTSSYVVTKGDANNSQDNFVVTPDQITGRVTEIHNEVADILTFIFGTFEYEAMGQSILRACAGFIALGICIAVFIVMCILIFEMITTTYFFKKYNMSLVYSSSYWVERIPNIKEQEDILKIYIDRYNNANIFMKILLAYQFRRYYDGLCNIEKEVNKTKKRIEHLNFFMNLKFFGQK